MHHPASILLGRTDVSMIAALFRFGLQHLSVLASWSLMAAAFLGLGLAFRRAVTRRGAGGEDLLLALWCGLALAILAALTWHFAFAINAYLTTLLAGAGLAALVLLRRDWLPVIARHAWREELPGAAIAAVYVLWVANRSLGFLDHYDSGMYHVPTVEWANAYAVVPGLGNLHGRLAFNAASLLYAAVLDVGPWDGASFHLANGFLLVAFGVPVMFSVGRLIRGRARMPLATDIFTAVLFLPAVAALLGDEANSLDTDVPVTLVVLFCATRLFAALHERPAEGDQGRWQFASLALLLTAAITLKVSAVVIAAALFVTAVWVYRGALGGVRGLATAMVAPALLLTAWLARGVVLSGYPLYPLAKFGFPVAWRVDESQAVAEAAWIRMSAKTLNHNRIAAGSDWFLPWAKELVSDPSLALYVPIPLVIAAAGLLWLLVRRRRRWTPAARRAALLLLAALGGAVFWLGAAPHPRFGQASLWLAAATVVGIAALCEVDRDALLGRTRRVSRYALALVLAGLVVYAVAPDAPQAGKRQRGRTLARLFSAPTAGGGLATMASPSLVRYRTQSGLELAVPRENNLCWRGPLLCTPHPEPNLRLRVPNDIASGFVSDGGVWRPLRWPNPWTPFLPYLACVRARGSGAERECLRETASAVTDTLQRLTEPADTVRPSTP